MGGQATWATGGPAAGVRPLTGRRGLEGRAAEHPTLYEPKASQTGCVRLHTKPMPLHTGGMAGGVMDRTLAASRCQEVVSRYFVTSPADEHRTGERREEMALEGPRGVGTAIAQCGEQGMGWIVTQAYNAAKVPAQGRQQQHAAVCAVRHRTAVASPRVPVSPLEALRSAPAHKRHLQLPMLVR